VSRLAPTRLSQRLAGVPLPYWPAGTVFLASPPAKFLRKAALNRSQNRHTAAIHLPPHYRILMLSLLKYHES
jgi:hypothetical protein